MRVVLSIAILVGIALILFIAIIVCKKVLKNRQERLALLRENTMLRNLFTLVQNEVNVQLQAGYSDVAAFNHLINDYKELKS